MYLLLLFLPLLSFFVIIFFSEFIGKKGSYLFSVLLMTLTFLISILIFVEINYNINVCNVRFFKWIDSGMFNIEWSFYFDSLTALMILMVNLVSLCVHCFSAEYMKTDFQQERFMALLSIFTFFMLILVTADNFLQLVLGWEGVGICSYLLINFWFMRKSTNEAGLKALFFNRIGDFALLLAMFIIFFEFKTFDFLIIFDNWEQLNQVFFFHMTFINLLNIVGFLLVIAAMAKSAQIFLNGWLLDAMEGPTPVSALIHAATMVTAGIYLLVRCSHILIHSSYSLSLIMIAGGITTLLCSLVGIDTFDLKKIIANSTASQLGYMFYVIGLTEFSTAISHLFFHAFFKALLFLGAGVIIHGLNDEQDIRCMGGLLKKMPFALLSMTIGGLALVGVPFLGGFYSKDPIVEYSYLLMFVENIMTVFICTLGAFNTAYYSAKMLFYVFFKESQKHKIVYSSLHVIDSNVSKFMLLPLVFLVICTFCVVIFEDLLFGEANFFWFFELDENIFLFKEGNEDYLAFVFLLFFSICGLFFGFQDEFFIDLFFLNFTTKILNLNIKDFNSFRWFFDLFYNKKIVNYYFNISDLFFLNFDRGFLENFGPNFIVNLINRLSKFFLIIQTGFLFHLVLFQLINILLIFGILKTNLIYFDNLSIVYFLIMSQFFFAIIFLVKIYNNSYNNKISK